ncbi:MAG: hypothetical protein JXB34_13965 [Bacteroidales bacterium]|nr:hypothetical protein [Bacteroidales bacterium]
MKLQAETLIETIVASLILTLTLMLSLSIFNNIVLSDSSKTKIKALNAIENHFFKINKTNLFVTGTTTWQNLKINQTVEDYSNDLYFLRIGVYKNDTILITESKRVIHSASKNKSIYNY